jgi:vitamin B12 transporter
VLVGLALGLAALPGALRAEERSAPVEVVSPPSAGSVTRITREEIERRQWRTLADVLRAQPGVHLSQLGGRGQDAVLFFRGNPTGNVLLRMDGIDLSDPSSDPLGSINDPQARAAGQIVPDLLTENIERIEIVRGPQSAGYGSDAIGGVIEIETRRGSGKLSPWASFEAGGFGTTQQSVGFGGGGERGGYSFAYTNAHTRGISAAPDELGNHERDGNDNDTLSGRVDLAPTDTLALRLTGRVIDEETQLDDPFPIPLALTAGTDPRFITSSVDRRNSEGERRRIYLGAETRLALLDERWLQTFGVRYSDHDVREDDSEQVRFQGLFFAGPSSAPQLENFSLENRDGTRLSFDWRSDVRLSAAHTLVLGAETERESIDQAQLRRQNSFALGFASTPPFQLIGTVPLVFRTQSRERRHESLRNNAVFVADRFVYGDVFGELALRLHDHDEYGSGLTYRAGIGYVEPSSKLRLFASIGTGFRDPDPALAADTTLRFDDTFPGFIGAAIRVQGPSTFEFTRPGDRTLGRAVSRGIELGLQAPLLDERLELGAAFFASRVRGLQAASSVFVSFDGQTFGTLDIDDSADARTRGVELSAAWSATPWLGLAVDYTYTHAELAHVRTEVTPGIAFTFVDDAPALVLAGTLQRLAGGFRAPLLNPSGTDLPGVPKHELHAHVELRPWEGLELGLGMRYVGPRTGTRLETLERLGGYTLFEASSSYAIGERVALFARLENLFDKQYRDLELAGQPGFAGFAGVRAVF